jgi:hypothetical protein
MGEGMLSGWAFKSSEVSTCMDMWLLSRGSWGRRAGGHSSCAWVPSWAGAEDIPSEFDCRFAIWLVSPWCAAGGLLIGIREDDDKYPHHRHHSAQSG